MPSFGNYRKMPAFLGQKLNSVKKEAMGSSGKGLLDGFLTATPMQNLRNIGVGQLNKFKDEIKEDLKEKAIDEAEKAIDKMAGKQ